MDSALTAFFDARSLQRGRALFRGGAVIDCGWDRDENMLTARVQGTQPYPYDVTVFIDERGDPEEAECSCPVEIDCKHAVAALLAHRAARGSHGAQDRYQPGGTPARGSAGEVGHAPGRSDVRGRPSDQPPDPAAERAARQVDRWWERWTATLGESDDAPARSRTPRRSRLYVLDVHDERPYPDAASIGVTLTLYDAPRTAAGHFSKGRRADPDRYYARHDTDLLGVDKDIEALGRADVQREDGRWARDAGRYRLRGRTGQLMLELAIGTDRCFLGNDRHQPLSQSPARALALDWQADANEQQRLAATLDGLERWWAVDIDPPWWIDPDTATAGPIDTALDGAQLALVLEAPAMPLARLEALADALPPSPHGPTLLPEPPVQLPPLIETEPTPVLLLHSPEDDPHVDAWRVTLLMRYGDALLPVEPFAEDGVERTEDAHGNAVRVRRRRIAERSHFIDLMGRATAMLPLFDESGENLSADFQAGGENAAERFGAYRRLVLERRDYERDGWQFAVLPPVHTEPLRPSRFDGLVERAEDDGPGWFDLTLGIEIDGVHHDLMPLVADFIERGGGEAPLIAELTDGRFAEIPASVLQPVADVLQELGLPADGERAVRLSRIRALALDALDGAFDAADIDTDWRGTREPFEFARRLRELADVNTGDFDRTTVPRGLKATLRPYQRAGLGWLNALAKHGLCGILADDMGLGKTLQTLAHILWLRQSRRLSGPVLVIVPTSLLLNWARETARFAPRLRVRVWHGADRHDEPLDVDALNLVITSYGLALRDRDLLAGQGFGLLVLDEAQQIRNAQAKTTRAIKSLPIERRLCLSGTPLENHLGELWSQFDFLMPDLLGDLQRFNRHYRTPIERHGDVGRQQRLAAAVRPFLLRRRKEEVATELPPKTEILREVRLGKEQATLYESIRASMQKRVRQALQAKGLAQSRVTVLDALLKLRQCCCHPELVKLDSARRVRDSAKSALALDMIDELVAEGRRILLFSSFTSMLSILESELAARGHRWVKLTGQTRKRDEAIDAFQHGDVPLFLISLKAGGVGLNLTAADTVIHYDPWWNPAAEAQASARAHRIGQDKPVFVYRLVTADTVEQRIVAMQRRKRDLADAMIEGGDGAALSSLSVEETLALFDPD